MVEMCVLFIHGRFVGLKCFVYACLSSTGLGLMDSSSTIRRKFAPSMGKSMLNLVAFGNVYIYWVTRILLGYVGHNFDAAIVAFGDGA